VCLSYVNPVLRHGLRENLAVTNEVEARIIPNDSSILLNVSQGTERDVVPSLRFPEEIAEYWDFGEEFDQVRVGRKDFTRAEVGGPGRLMVASAARANV